MPSDHKPAREIAHGNAYPFDASNDWWHSSGGNPPEPKDWAVSAARGIIANLQGRQGIKHQLAEGEIDEKTRREIVNQIARIIRYAARRANH